MATAATRSETPQAIDLDGEWTNPASTTDTGDSVYPSGNGTTGGNFNFRFNVLPGDANQDGLVNISDLTALASHWQQTSQGFLSTDMNNDGQVNISDLTMLASNWQKSLPTGTPAPGSFPAAVPLVVAAATPSQADVVDAAVADTASLAQPVAFVAATLPAQPSLIQGDALNVSPAAAVVTTSQVNSVQPTALNIAAALTADVGDSSSQPTLLVESRATPFVVGPSVSAVHNLWAAALGAAAVRPTMPGADLLDSTNLSSLLAEEKSMGTERPVGDHVRAVFAYQARSGDAVLPEELAAAVDNEASWLSYPADALDALTGAVDQVMAAYSDESCNV